MKECHAFIAEEDCISYAVAHLAVARSQNTGNGTLGNGRLRVLQIAVPFLIYATWRALIGADDSIS